MCTPHEILINSPSPQTCLSVHFHELVDTKKLCSAQYPILSRCLLCFATSIFYILTPELFNLKKAHHVSSESEHLRNSDKFFLSSSGIRAWLVLVPKGCKSSKPDKVPRTVSIPTHTKLWKRFKFQQPFDKING